MTAPVNALLHLLSRAELFIFEREPKWSISVGGAPAALAPILTTCGLAGVAVEPLPPTMPMADTATFAAHSERNNFKPINQDAAGAGFVVNPLGIPVRVVVVADGVSSAATSAVAAQLAVRDFLEYVSRTAVAQADALASRALGEFFGPLNAQLVAMAEPHPSTTFTAWCGYPDGSHVIFHAGDSRAYFIEPAGRYLVRLTQDHDRRGEARAQGKDRRAQMLVRDNAISRYLGGTQNVWQPDILVDHAEVEGDGVVFVSTDGVHDYLSDDQLLGLYHQARRDPAEFCQLAVHRAQQMWSPQGLPNRDNVSVSAIRCGGILPGVLPEPRVAGAADPDAVREMPSKRSEPAAAGLAPLAASDRPENTDFWDRHGRALAFVALGLVAILAVAVVFFTWQIRATP